jgi:hypothetical protein
MKSLYVLMHQKGTTPVAVYDDPWAAAIDLIEREEALPDPDITFVQHRTGRAFQLRRKNIVKALTDDQHSDVTTRQYVIHNYDANDGRPHTDVGTMATELRSDLQEIEDALNDIGSVALAEVQARCDQALMCARDAIERLDTRTDAKKAS